MIFLFCTLNNEQRELVEQFFHKHHMQFQRIAFKIVKSEAMAEDAVGTAFIKIMDNIEKISNLPDQKMKAFCVVIVKNTSIDMIRQSQKNVRVEYLESLPDQGICNVEDTCIHNADIHKLTELIDQLDPADRNFIYLRYTLEMGYREIGALLNISEDAAKKRGQRLIKKLRNQYESG